jgi:hypothetical protein
MFAICGEVFCRIPRSEEISSLVSFFKRSKRSAMAETQEKEVHPVEVPAGGEFDLPPLLQYGKAPSISGSHTFLPSVVL